jgi:hypothetical protein
MSDIPLCVKTPKGIEAVEKRAHNLPMRARQILIMIDGKRDSAMLATMFPGDALDGILDQLLADGFITPLKVVKAEVQKAATEKTPAAPPSPPPPADEGERYQMARNFMINTTNTFIGISASSLIERMEHAKNLEELRHHYTEWRDTIRLSSAGRARLPEFEKQLAALLS